MSLTTIIPFITITGLMFRLSLCLYFFFRDQLEKGENRDHRALMAFRLYGANIYNIVTQKHLY